MESQAILQDKTQAKTLDKVEDFIEVVDDEDDGIEPRMFSDVPPPTAGAESDIDAAGKRDGQFGRIVTYGRKRFLWLGAVRSC